MLGIKGLNSNKLLIDINKIKYLVFSLTNNNSELITKKGSDKLVKDIFYSVSLIIPDYINENIEKRT
jgi:hypothetical protein